MSSAKTKKKNPLLAMSAGCIAGGIEATAVWPMEFIKVCRLAVLWFTDHDFSFSITHALFPLVDTTSTTSQNQGSPTSVHWDVVGLDVHGPDDGVFQSLQRFGSHSYWIHPESRDSVWNECLSQGAIAGW